MPSVSDLSTENAEHAIVHKCRFIEYMPSGITAMAWTPASSKTKLLAVARENGEIQLWNPKGSSWYLEKKIAGSKHSPIESIMFIHQSKLRLIAASLDGRVLEYSLDGLRVIQEADSHGGGVWSMAANQMQTRLAIGCEDGVIRILDIEEGNLVYLKSLERHDGRVISLDWSVESDHIIAGSDKSSIRKYDLSLGRCIAKMTVDKINKEENVVWSVMFLRNATFVSGDSSGNLIFWDSSSCTAIKTIKAHSADILCMAMKNDGTQFYSTGVDRKVVQLTMTDVDNPSSWVVSGEKRYHSHDVRSILWIQDRPHECLVTGGMDTLLIMSSPVNEFPHLKQYRMPSFPHSPPIQLAQSAKLLMARLENCIQIWRLGDVITPSVKDCTYEDRQRLASSKPKLIFNLKLDSTFNLDSSAISNDGRCLAVSSAEGIRFFTLDYKEENYSINKAKNFPSESLPPACSLIFSADSKRIIISGMDSSIYILDISQNDMDAPNFSLLGRLDLLNIGENSKGATDILTAHMAVSSDDQWLAIATHNHQVLIFHLDSLRLYAKLPLYDYPVTCLSFHPQNSTLAIALTSNQFYLYDVEKAAYEDWTREYLNRLPSRLLNRKEIIMGCCFNASKPNGLILWGSTYFCNVDLQKSVGSSDLLISESKRKKVEGTEENSSKSCKNSKNDGFSESFKMDHRYGPLMFLDCIGNEIVIVERPALSIMKNLPLSYYKHAYGT